MIRRFLRDLFTKNHGGSSDALQVRGSSLLRTFVCPSEHAFYSALRHWRKQFGTLLPNMSPLNPFLSSHIAILPNQSIYVNDMKRALLYAACLVAATTVNGLFVS